MPLPLCVLQLEASAVLTSWLDSGGTMFFLTVTCARTTGEFWAMTLDERRRVAAAARRHFPGKIIVNVSACALGDVHALLEHCVSESEVLKKLPNYARMPAASSDGTCLCS